MHCNLEERFLKSIISPLQKIFSNTGFLVLKLLRVTIINTTFQTIDRQRNQERRVMLGSLKTSLYYCEISIVTSNFIIVLAVNYSASVFEY